MHLVRAPEPPTGQQGCGHQTFRCGGACARRDMLSLQISLQISKLLLQPLSMAACKHNQDDTVQRRHFAEQQLGRLGMA